MTRFWFPLLAGLLFSAVGKADEPSGAERQLRELLDQAWEFQLRENPLLATRVGDHRFNDRLPDSSLANLERQNAFQRQLLDRLQAIPQDALSDSARIDYQILDQSLRNDLAEYEFQLHLMPLTNRWGFHIAFPELPQRVPLRTVQDYRNYLARLEAFPRYAEQQMDLLAAGIREGLVLPAVVMEGYDQTILPHIVDDPRDSLLMAPLLDLPESFSETDRQALREAGRRAVAERVVPTYRRFLEFMRATYLPACRGSIAASALPQGRALYRQRVRHYTTLDLTPEAVHQTGLDEVARIRREMDAAIARARFSGGFSEFVAHLRNEPRFYADSPEQLQKEVSWILKRMDGQLPRLFKTLPRTPYGLREVPPYIAPKTTSAYYTQPAGDGTGAGYYYINTYNLRSRPLFEMEALSLHEAVPGHHLQLALQQELRDLHPWRRFTEFTAFVEGWALYAERLGLEVGFYQDPYSDFGRLSFEMWRACRLVVDTGIHYLGWTRQQAIQYMADNTALSLHNITAEVDRYISWPGQALAYKTGELEIRALRQKAETELGESFDVREFHDVVLGSGSVPLTVLRDNVQRYLRTARK